MSAFLNLFVVSVYSEVKRATAMAEGMITTARATRSVEYENAYRSCRGGKRAPALKPVNRYSPAKERSMKKKRTANACFERE